MDQLTAEEERFFYRLIVNCEDYGRLDARPAVLRAKCFPVKLNSEGNFTIKLTELVGWLTGLVKAQLLVIYENGGKPYLQILKWSDHQQIRAKNPKYPGLDDEGSQVVSFDNICNHLLSDDNARKQVCADSYIRNTNTKERNNRNTNKSNTTNVTKKQYSEAGNVSLTDEEYEKLIAKFGKSGADDWIEELSIGKSAKGYKYKSDYAAILNWARREDKRNGQPSNGSRGNPKNDEGAHKGSGGKYSQYDRMVGG